MRTSKSWTKCANAENVQPAGDDSGRFLGIDVRRGKRKDHADGKLCKARHQRLSAIGLRWENLLERNWKKYYAEAKAFFEEHGHLNIAADCPSESGINLNDWLKGQCRLLSDGKLPAERRKLLEEFGLTAKGDSWEERYDEAKAFYEKYGHLQISYKDPLRQWIDKQKKSIGGRRKASGLRRENRAVGGDWNRLVPCE